jgi:hypothetical protein
MAIRYAALSGLGNYLYYNHRALPYAGICSPFQGWKTYCLYHIIIFIIIIGFCPMRGCVALSG